MRVRKDKTKASHKSGPLDNQKWEAFARYIANGETQANAAKLAGFKEKNAHIRGCILMKKPAVKIRVDELKRVSSESAIMGLSVSKSLILEQLRENCEAAMEEGDRSAANRALELMGKEIGMFKDVKIIGLQALIQELTPQNLKLASADELLKLISVIESTLPALPPDSEPESV